MSFLDTLGTTIVKGVSDAFSPASLITGALSFLGGERRNQQQQQSAEAANAFSAQQYATRYQTTVKDMQAAGLNPMLAYTQGTGSAQPSGQMAQYQDTISPAVASFQSQNLQESQQEANYGSAAQARANVKLINETVNKTKEEVNNLQSTNEQIKAITDNLHQQLMNLIDEGANIKAQNSVLRVTASKIIRETGLMDSQEKVNQARAALDKVEAELRGFDVQSAKGAGNLGRDFQQYKPILDVLSNLLRRR